jgi:hypothetical protein
MVGVFSDEFKIPNSLDINDDFRILIGNPSLED